MTEQIEAILRQHKEEHTAAIREAEATLKAAVGDQEQKNALGKLINLKRSGTRASLAQKVMEVGRKMDHVDRKAKQPSLELHTGPRNTFLPDKTLGILTEYFRRDPTPQELEEKMEGLDLLLLTLQECLDSNDLQDSVHAMAEVCRKVWLIQMHSAGMPIKPVVKG